MEAGQLTEFISLQRAIAAQDAFGENADTWSTYATAWARVEMLTAAARLVRQQLVIDATHRLTIRHTADVLTTDRVLWGTRILDIVSAIDPDQRHEMLILECKESM